PRTRVVPGHARRGAGGRPASASGRGVRLQHREPADLAVLGRRRATAGSRAGPQLLRPAPGDMGDRRVPACLRRVDPVVPVERLRGARPGRAPTPRSSPDHVSGVPPRRVGPSVAGGEHLDAPEARMSAHGVAPSPARARPGVRPGLAVGLAVLALGWSVAALPELRGTEDPRPNVIVIVTDDQSDAAIPTPYAVMLFLARPHL